MSATATRPDFNAIYFDTNILIGHRWPKARPELHNVLRLARWWDIAIYFPEAVIQELEAHRQREFQGAATQLKAATRKLEKAALPIECDVAVTYSATEVVLERFRQASNEATERLGIRHLGFTQRSVQDLFGYASRYARPFAIDGEGKGFQDVVILLSVLDHVRDQQDVRGVLVTEDGDFKNLNYGTFTHGFEATRLQILNLKTTFKQLFDPYFDQTRLRPYRMLRAAAEQMAQAKVDEIRDFAASRITPEMFRPSIGDTIVKVLAVEKVEIRRVDLPFPEEPPTNVTIDVTISVAITCKVVVSTDFAGLRVFFGELNGPSTPPTEREKTSMSLAIVQASGAVVDGELKELHLAELAKDES